MCLFKNRIPGLQPISAVIVGTVLGLALKLHSKPVGVDRDFESLLFLVCGEPLGNTRKRIGFRLRD